MDRAFLILYRDERLINSPYKRVWVNATNWEKAWDDFESNNAGLYKLTPIAIIFKEDVGENRNHFYAETKHNGGKLSDNDMGMVYESLQMEMHNLGAWQNRPKGLTLNEVKEILNGTT